jgi:hypothetical protein
VDGVCEFFLCTKPYAPTSHPMFVMVERTPKICVDATFQGRDSGPYGPKTPAWRVGLCTDTLLASLSPTQNSSRNQAGDFGLLPEIPTEATWSRKLHPPRAGVSGPRLLASRDPAGVHVRCQPRVRPKTFVSGRRLRCGHD